MNNSRQDKKINYYFVWTVVVIVLTFVAFTAALFTKGFTHDFLLEAGVFLISIRLIIMSYKNSIGLKNIKKEIKEVQRLLKKENL